MTDIVHDGESSAHAASLGDRLVRTIAWIGGLAVMTLMFYTVGSVIARATRGVPLPALIEISSRWLMLPLGYAGFVVALRADEHIDVQLLPDLVSDRARSWLVGLSRTVMIAFLSVVGYLAWVGADRNRQNGERGLDTGLAIWPTRYVVLVGVVVMLALLAVRVWRSARRVRASTREVGAP